MKDQNWKLKNGDIIKSLIISDLKARYASSMMGTLWFFLLPLVNVGIIWFAFEFGFRHTQSSDTPFVLWLLAGMVPWLFFLDAISTAMNSIIEKSFLVKKIVFKVELLPLIKIGVSCVLLLFLSLVLGGFLYSYAVSPSVYWLQYPYYILCLIALVLSVSWMTSCLVVFYRDLGHIIGVLLQVTFWATPIFWDPSNLPVQFQAITILNPLAYVVIGFRETFFLNVWFWEHPRSTFVFWFTITVLAFSSLWLYRKLRPHFADLL